MQHKSLAEGRWAEMSFSMQMANVGSEVSRTKKWLIKGNEQQAERAFDRCLELIYLTIKFADRSAIYQEICRFRELFNKAYLEKDIQELEYFDRYCTQFAMNKNK
ncbi:MAG: hypothetical protein FWD02_06285 [Bacteroidales bacterium]|nr:hypothetical protein [Bacteroidales bacterium]